MGAKKGKATAKELCPFCDDELRSGSPPPRCPFHGEAECPLLTQPAPGNATSAALGETIAYRPEACDDDVEPDDGFPEIDDLVDASLGQYRMGEVIGRGSMGRVYRAEHAGLGRTCAIKVMNPGLVQRLPQILERFWAEARALAGLMHPHVVTVHNLGSDRGYHYIEMEYVPGGNSLKEAIVRDGELDPLRATTLVRQVAQALGSAHKAGLVHRDVKPANVLLAADGKAKLADFGLVRGMSAQELAGAPVAGTPTFMAPELFRGAPASPSTDLYALGVMFFYLLTSRLPFTGDGLPDLIRMHQRAPVPDVRKFAPKLTDEIAAIITRCLAKRPVERYTSTEELIEELQNAIFHLRDTETLIRESLEGLDGVVEGQGDRWRVLLKVPGDRLQEVRIDVTQSRLNKRLLSVYSVCCSADPGHYEFALRLNAELAYGGLSVREVDGQPMFVMTRAYPGVHASPDEIRAAVLEIARRGDWVEQQLTQSDVF